MSEWVNPTSIVDPEGAFTNKDNAGDGNTGTFAQQDGTYGDWLEAYYAGGIECDKIRLWLFNRAVSAEIQVQYDGGWQTTFNNVPLQSQYQEFNIDPVRTLTGIRVKSAGPHGPYWRVRVIQFGQVTGFLASA